MRLSDKEVYISVNNTVLTTKCDDDEEPTQTVAQGSNILSLDPGCKIHSANFKVSRNKQMFMEEVTARLINSPAVPMWNLLSEKVDEQEVQSLLNEMLDEEPSGLTIPGIEAKFGLHTLHKKSHDNRVINLSTSGVISFMIIGGILYLCRHNFTCAHKP